MKYLNNFNPINEAWRPTLIKSLTFERDEDIKSYFIELFDEGWELDDAATEHIIGDKNFRIDKDSRMSYVDEPLYKQYEISLTCTNNLKYKKNKFFAFDTLEIITTGIERFKDDGYNLIILDMTIGVQNPTETLTITFYHKDDIIPWEKIFIKGER
jgi:hypothetical protein